MSYWWCLKHERVEPDKGCGHAERLGPYPSEADAKHALEKAHDRTEAWDSQDRKEKEWGNSWDDEAMP